MLFPIGRFQQASILPALSQPEILPMLWWHHHTLGIVCPRVAANHEKIPLTTAFANKAVTTVWGLIWGTIIFREPLTGGKLAGVALVVTGIILFSQADRRVLET